MSLSILLWMWHLHLCYSLLSWKLRVYLRHLAQRKWVGWTVKEVKTFWISAVLSPPSRKRANGDDEWDLMLAAEIILLPSFTISPRNAGDIMWKAQSYFVCRYSAVQREYMLLNVYKLLYWISSCTARINAALAFFALLTCLQQCHHDKFLHICCTWRTKWF